MSKRFYRAFEDQFRGSHTLILGRLQIYQSLLESLREVFGSAPRALDLGCGRGEWLEILEGAGFSALGVDSDEGMLAACQERKLQVERLDLFAALSKTPDSSLALVSAFHVAEHLPFDLLQLLVQESLRVLRPGGILILETPNPENIAVGSHLFYMDPTHERPIPPNLLRFMPEHYGFARAHIWRLQERDGLASGESLSLIDVLQEASPDFAVIAQKAGHTDVMEWFDRDFTRTVGVSMEQLAVRYDSQLHQQLNQIQRLQIELIGVYQSRSWRITEPVRQLSNWLAQARSKLRMVIFEIISQCRFLAQWMLAVLVELFKRYPQKFGRLESVLQNRYPRVYSRAINCYLRRQQQMVSVPLLGETGRKIARQLDQDQSTLRDE
jgi:O-antigen chain-terminating methyltransferase